MLTASSMSMLARAPASAERISEIVSKHCDSPEKGTAISADLKALSSKHKFVVQFTSVEGPTDDLHIISDFTACWDQENDGYVCFQVSDPNGKRTVIVVFWILVA